MSEPYYQDEHVTLYHGDCLDVLRTLPDNSVHAVCTDPPYGLANTDPAHVAETITRWVNGDRTYLPGGSGFMGKAWDAFVPPVAVWDECLRVLKPGGHVLAFAGSRTHDLMTLALRLAGFEIRDSIAWLYGSGFPKSHSVSKHIDRTLGAERPKNKEIPTGGMSAWKVENGGQATHWIATAKANGVKTVKVANDDPITPDAERWQGWGTALKPAFEPIVVARKPLAGTVAANVLQWGTGALNIDACRVNTGEAWGGNAQASTSRNGYGPNDADGWSGNWTKRSESHTAGRWPTNVLLDDTQAAELDRQSGTTRDGVAVNRNRGDERPMTVAGTPRKVLHEDHGYGGEGGASRFFPTFRYEAKAPTEERPRVDGIAHPTVKPLDLMRWVVRLVTPPGGTVLDPFAGSGTTAEACLHEGFRCIAIEREADYLPLIKARLDKPMTPPLDLGSLT